MMRRLFGRLNNAFGSSRSTSSAYQNLAHWAHTILRVTTD